jgi:hypothetical protein
MKCCIIGFMLLVMTTFGAGQSTDELPYVYLKAASDQSKEMTKGFVEDCPNVRVAEVQSDADYFADLSHSEVGLPARDHRLVVTDAWGMDLKTVEGNGLRDEVKSACALIMADWSDQALTRKKYLDAINAGFRKDGVKGSAEMVGDNLIVRSERADRMRFKMLLANNKTPLRLKRAGIVTFIYTKDAGQNFAYDVKSGQINENYDMKAARKAVDTTSK